MSETAALEEEKKEQESGKVIPYEAVGNTVGTVGLPVAAETPKESAASAQATGSSKESGVSVEATGCSEESAASVEATGSSVGAAALAEETETSERESQEVFEEDEEDEADDELGEDTQSYADFLEEERKNRFFRFGRKDQDFSRDKWILSHIKDEDLMEYLILEQKRTEQIQKAKEIRDRRIITTVQLAISLAAVVAVIYFLKDNPVILTNILYIFGILAALWFWKKPKK